MAVPRGQEGGKPTPASPRLEPIGCDFAGVDVSRGFSGHPPRPELSGSGMSTPGSQAEEATSDPVPSPPGPIPPEPLGTLRTLLLATGGAGSSWPCCVLPFGALATLAGAAATAITFSLRGPLLDLAQSASLAALGGGLGLLIAACLCWHTRRWRRRREGGGGRRELEMP